MGGFLAGRSTAQKSLIAGTGIDVSCVGVFSGRFCSVVVLLLVVACWCYCCGDSGVGVYCRIINGGGGWL